MSDRLQLPICLLGGSVPVLATTVLLSGILPSPAFAETRLQCNATSTIGVTLLNQATSNYSDEDGTVLGSASAAVAGQMTRGGTLSIASVGVFDRDRNLIYSLGTIAASLNTTFVAQGWSQEEANVGSVAAIKAFAGLPNDAALQQTIGAIKSALLIAVPGKATEIDRGSWDTTLALAVVGLAPAALQSIGFTDTDAQTAANAAIAVISTSAGTVQFSQMAQIAVQDAVRAVPGQAALLSAANQALVADLSSIRDRKNTGLHAGDTLRFKFALTNTGSAPIDVTLPTVSEIQQTGMAGSATATAVTIEGSDGGSSEGATPAPTALSLAAGQQMNLWIDTTIGTIPETASALAIGFSSGCGGGIAQQMITLLPPSSSLRLDNPFGQVTGCDGAPLSDYRGIRVALYRPAANENTGDVGNLLRLSATEFPDNPNNAIPAGFDPNRENRNPFQLTAEEQGKYQFLLSPEQLRPRQAYILVVSPPADSEYSERRIRLVMGDRTSQGIAYRATALDGLPLSANARRTAIDGILRTDGETGSLFLVDLNLSICQSESIQITKTGDRAAAAPGDTVIYRLLVRNLSSAGIDRLLITDTLPLGFNLLADSVRAEIGNRSVSLTTHRDGATVSFQLNQALPEDATLTIAYGAQLTPDALRGTGQNSAIARGRRDDNDWTVRDGPAVHRLRVEPGIITDCGTILGRVFVDRNFDGEQQPGEPGVANAVIYLDDGNRISTDANGLFSVANVLPGYRTGALDLTSIPDYTLAPNERFIERNSPSRLVHLAPGSLVRMNFGVMPATQEASEP